MRRIISALVVALAASCASLVTPTSFDQRAAYVQGSITSTRNTCAGLLERGRMSVEDGRTCLSTTDQANDALRAARTTTGSPAEDALATAQRLMTSLEAMLRRYQP